jgi:transcriptional regulator with XRE-family HTH domain
MKKKKKTLTKKEIEEMAAFGERLKYARELLRLKQKKMSPFMEVTASSVSGLEKGKSKPSFDVLKNLYKNLNISINFLMDGSGEAIIDREMSSALHLDETNPEDEKLREMLYYIENAPMVKYAIFEFFSNYIYQNKEAIKEDMKKHRQYLQRIKQKNRLKKNPSDKK